MTFPGWNGWTDHVHVTERETAHRWPDGRWDNAAWEDCLWTSSVMFARAAGLDIPATHAEAEALRADAGEDVTSGSNFGDLRKGWTRRYGSLGVSLPLATYSSGVWAAMVPGTVAIVNGSMGVWTANSHWNRWDPGFAGGHSVCAMRLDASDRVWWCNPQAPAGHEGEWMPKADFVKYIAGWSSIIAKIRSDTMPDIEHKIERWTLDGAGQVTTYGAPLKPDGTVDYSQRLAFVSGQGGVNPRLRMIERSRLTTPRADRDEAFRAALAAYELPTGTPSEAACKPYSDAAYAQGKADGEVVGVATGVANEQERIKGVLGLP